MNLSDYEFLPGIVTNVEDPKHIGRVKAMVPTLLDAGTMSDEALPWIYPIDMPGYQRFSKLENGRKIWVIHHKTNYNEYWYFPMFELNTETKAIVDKYDSTEVLCARSFGGNSVFIYYNESEGIVMKVGEAKINITPSNEIHITDGGSFMKIVGGIITIGKSEGEKSVLGEQLKSKLTQLAENLQQIGVDAGKNPHASVISEACLKASTDLSSKIEEILSDTVRISK